MTTPNQAIVAGLVRPRVLIVDDTKDNRILVTRRLRGRGYEVTEAANGVDALELLAREAFDAVLLDVVMPGMDGFQVLQAIREQPHLDDLPVIMATVMDETQDVVQALRAGANDYVVKPIDFAVLRARLDVHIRRKQAETCVRQSQPELEGVVAELRSALAEAEATARLKANFLADLSHEIRTPLNGILGVTRALGDAATDPWQARMLATITDSAAALERLLSDALDLSRAEAGALEIRRERFDLVLLLERCAGLFEPLALGKGLAFELDVSPGARVWVMGDCLRLQQILSNLISNAVKFTSQGKVSCAVAVDPEGRFQFEVRDTGVGFDETVAPELFKRFKQADGDVAARFGGSGLGLAISRRLAHLMGGEITVSSRPQQGSVFTLRLPLPVADAPQSRSLGTKPAPSPSAIGPRPRILVAEDHPTNRLVVELTLQGSDVDLVLVGNGAEAVDMFCSQDFDCVLMDLEMPVMDGLSAIREIRSHELRRGSPRVTILALSAHASDDHKHLSASAGADGHLTKPIHPDALLRALDDIINGDRAPIQAPGAADPGPRQAAGVPNR